MKIAIMQPYLFPYIGYFQLINSVELFVIYDDVKYIKNGWINRNKILYHGQEHLFTFGLKRSSSYLYIKDKYFSDSHKTESENFLRLLYDSYSKAPYYSDTSQIIEEILYTTDQNIATKIRESIIKICGYLDISTSFYVSSQLIKDNQLKGEERVIEINKVLGADYYINPIGGKELYSRERFLNAGIILKFLKPSITSYNQFNHKFVSSLSIIDVLMFNSREKVKKMLEEYELYDE